MTEKLKIATLGQGPDLVLLHGWAMHSGIWGGVVDELATGFRVHLVDLPGHGVNRHIPLSRNLDAVTEQVLAGVPPAIWVGWSLGGLVALAAALQKPGSIKQMVLVGATPSFAKQENWEWGLGTTAQRAFADGIENDFEGAISHFALQTFGARCLHESLGRLGKPPLTWNLPSRDTMNDGLYLLYNNNLLPDLKNCKMPALFLGGSRDRTIRPESFGKAASMMPDARAEIITGASHAPFISHEEEFLKIIRRFLT